MLCFKPSGPNGASLAFSRRKSREITGDRLSVPGGRTIVIAVEYKNAEDGL